MIIKRMGVMNVTPNSFSDGGEFFSSDSILKKLHFLAQFEVIDIGAESTAPMNSSLDWQDEWSRWQMVLPHLKNLNTTISADTYHPETIFELVKFWKDHHLNSKLIWNDVSGKMDDSVRDFLKTGFDYVLCHNLAPSRELTGKHMDYIHKDLNLVDYFLPHSHPQILFDPCIGFSKSYDQNCFVLDHFTDLQKQTGHERWVLGFSRKSILQKKFETKDRDRLDQLHVDEINRILHRGQGEVWIRTHRPELVPHKIGELARGT